MPKSSACNSPTGAVVGVINYFYQQKLQSQIEQLKNTLEWERARKEKAAGVAEVVSLWIKRQYEERERLDLWEVQSKYYELCLWLDHDTLVTLNKALCGRDATPKDVLVQARKVLLSLNEPDFQPGDLVHWDPPEGPPIWETPKDSKPS